MSVYTEYLKELASCSAKIDNMRVTHNGFGELQKLEAAIISAEHKGYYSNTKRRQLSAIAAMLHDEYREALRLKESVKEIERQINRGRRQEQRRKTA